MKIIRTGLIINTQFYDECVEFYQKLFSLPVLFNETDGDFKLTCFDYFGSYLMIETGGTAATPGRLVSDCPIKLRFNVEDIDEACAELRAAGIQADIRKSEWGNTINIFDPDGNRVGIRDERTFSSQIV